MRRNGWVSVVFFGIIVSVALLDLPSARASGPRYVNGYPYFWYNNGNPIGWNPGTAKYFTDPGDLSASVNHQAADALVAAAAGVWNVPVANITLAQGGMLAEHVSGSNVYLSNTGMVYPADVTSSNSANIPIAVIYDSDGSVTETLLGGGASDPAECLRNGVTESVDGISQQGYLFHAVLILNGRCTGAAPAQQLQLQYQLERAFGRILGLAWSQTNDNVFTGTPTPTYDQAENWPILHPIDILCSPYPYQCLPEPFQLRQDDIASLVLLYPITQGTPPSGKTFTYAQANAFSGTIQFPTGEGMAGVNVLIYREIYGGPTPQDYATASAVSGMQYRRVQPTAIIPAAGTLYASEGSFDQSQQGFYNIAYLPLVQENWADYLVMSTEPVNPLYSGIYAVGPYTAGTVHPSGSSQTLTSYGVYNGIPWAVSSTVADAASTCGNGADGTAAEPVAPAASGWWNGLLCGYNHSSWIVFDVRPSRTFRLEVTALDEQGYATTAKAMPVMGAWASTDSTSSLPTLAAQTGAFNALDLGMTSMPVATGTATGVQLAIADERGDGRPDYAYQARILYADSIFPSTVPAAGGTATITGMGFRPGNVVTVNGVNAIVSSWSSNTIALTLPTMSSAHATNLSAVDIVVSDISTGGSSTMSGALTYDTTTSLPNEMKLLSVQVGTTFVGTATSVPFSVQVVGPDGTTPVVGDSVVFSGSAGVQFGVCGAATCTVLTDSTGVATTSVIPQTAGSITVTATDQALSQSASFTAIATAGAMQLISAPSGSVYVGISAGTAFAVSATQSNGSPAVGQEIVFSATYGSVSFDACIAATCTVLTNAQGIASTGITPKAAGATTIRAALGSLSQSASFTALANAPLLSILTAPTGSFPDQTQAPTNFQVGLTQADGVTPIPSQPIVFSVIPISGGAAANGILFGPCNLSTCTQLTDYLGHAAVVLVLSQPGTYTIQAAFGQIVKTISITVQSQALSLKLISAPSGNQLMGGFLATPFKVQLVGGDGVTGIPGEGVLLGGVLGTLAVQSCNAGSSSCVFTTDNNGYVTATVQPLVLGLITLEATINNLVLNTSFTSVAAVDTMQLVSAPASAIYPGAAPTTPFSVKVIGAGQLNGTPGKSVVLSVTGGSATLGACGSATCTVLTDSNGLAQTTVTPLATGTVSLQAADGAVTETASFPVSAAPDVLLLTSAPSGNAFVGEIIATPFAVQALLAGGVTPAPWRSITLSVTGGSATLTTCGSPGCVLWSDSNGRVSSSVQPLAAGPITLMAIDGTVSQTATFNAVASTETLRLVTAPSGNVVVATPATTPFAVQVLATDGVTPIVGRLVTFTVTAGTGSLAGCATASCALFTGANGIVSTTLTPSATGPFTVQAADGAQVQTATINGIAGSDVLRLVTAPSGNVIVGATAATPFAVQVLAAGGVTPIVGRSVLFTIASGAGAIAGCSSASCTLVSGANGLISTTLTPSTAGVFTVQAADGTQIQTATINAIAGTETLRLVTAPSGSVLVGTPASTPFAVQVIAPDGVTPVVGRSITFTITSGAGSVAGCGSTACTLVSGANGLISTTLTPSAVGVFTVQAADGTQIQNATINGMTESASLIAAMPQLYVAEAAVLPWTLSASATIGGAAASGVTVNWTGSTGLAVPGTQTTTSSAGSTSVTATAGPLAAGASATTNACLLPLPQISNTACVQFQATGSSASAWQIQILSGGTQSVSGGAILGSVVARVVDGAGNPVAGATISIAQTVTERTVTCPSLGRCPSAPVLSSGTSQALTDVTGQTTIVPLTVNGVATATNIALSAGTAGFATVVLDRSP